MVGSTNIGLTYKPTDIVEKGTVILRSCNIKNGKIDLSDLIKVKTQIQNNQYIENNDILICARNGSKSLVGKCAIIQDFNEKTSFGAFMAIFRSTCYKYIYYFFNTSFFRSIFENDDTKQINQLTQAMLKNTLIPLPPFAEQQRIANRLIQIFALIEYIDTGTNDVEHLIALTKSKILDLAIRGKLVPQDPNDEPADVLLERIRKEKEELIKQGKIKKDKKECIIFKGDDNSYYEQFEKNIENINDEIPFDIPDSWKWTRLGSYAQKITDYVASGSFASLRENVPVLKNKDYAIMVKTADFSNNFTQNLTYTTEHGYNYLENSNLFGGELILSNIGSIGKVFIVPKLNQKMTLAPNTVMIKLLNEEHRDYVYNFLLSPFGYSQLLKISGGTGIAKFNKTDLKTLLLPIPPIQEQDRIIKQIKKLFELLSEVENSIK